MKLWPALAGMFVASSVSCAPVAPRFDLLCNGTYTDTGSAPRAFSTRFRIDLSTMRFCIDRCKAVLHLTRASSDYLEYDYDDSVADEDHRANRNRGAFPYYLSEFRDEFSVDLASGEFRRFYQYVYGDVAGEPHSQRFAGRCTKGAFTPFPDQPR